MEQKEQEKRKPRFKRLLIDSGQMLQIITGANNKGWITLPKINGLPEGCEVLAVHYEPQYNSFAFKLYHESFDPIHSGAAVPFIGLGTGITYEHFDFRKLREKENGINTD